MRMPYKYVNVYECDLRDTTEKMSMVIKKAIFFSTSSKTPSKYTSMMVKYTYHNILYTDVWHVRSDYYSDDGWFASMFWMYWNLDPFKEEAV